MWDFVSRVVPDAIPVSGVLPDAIPVSGMHGTPRPLCCIYKWSRDCSYSCTEPDLSVVLCPVLQPSPTSSFSSIHFSSFFSKASTYAGLVDGKSKKCVMWLPIPFLLTKRSYSLRAGLPLKHTYLIPLKRLKSSRNR